jgi:hypothetical protein
MRDLCMVQKIMAFPMLRFFKNKEAQPPDYRSDRTVEAMIEFVRQRLATDEHLSQLAPDEKERHLKLKEEARDDHPGCLMSGFLLVNR